MMVTFLGASALYTNTATVKWCRAWGEVPWITGTGTSSRPETTSPIGINSPRLGCIAYSPMLPRQDRATGRLFLRHPLWGRQRRGYPNSALDSTNRTRSTCREIGNLW